MGEDMDLNAGTILDGTESLEEVGRRIFEKIIALTNLAARGAEDGLDREVTAFGELFDTADAKEGTAAFLEKRKPLFKGI